jgi:hypothetical protein
MKKKSGQHYVDNKRLYGEMLHYINALNEAKQNGLTGNELPRISDYIGKCIFLIAQKLATANKQIVVIQPATIRHIAVAHVMGYGYIIMGAAAGQKLPELDATGQSNGVSLPSHDHVWPSLLDLLMWLQSDAKGFDLRYMVLQA